MTSCLCPPLRRFFPFLVHTSLAPIVYRLIYIVFSISLRILFFSVPLVGRFRKKTFPFGWHGRYNVLNTVTLDWWSSWVVPPLEDWVEAELFLSERRDDSQFAGRTQYVVFISAGASLTITQYQSSSLKFINLLCLYFLFWYLYYSPISL